MIEISLIKEPLNVTSFINACYDDSCGAVTTFIGTVRNSNKGKEVLYLDFEAFEPMALKELNTIAQTVVERWNVQKIAIAHRLGKVTIGEEAVVIAVSTPHRRASFESCEYVIDTLKKTVPIWKKEVYSSGATWISAHP